MKNLHKIIHAELYKRIDEILYYKWDPISVSNEPYARAEYESYVRDLYDLIVNGKNEEEISNFLCNIETSKMGLSKANIGNTKKVAALLIEHKRALDDGCA